MKGLIQRLLIVTLTLTLFACGGSDGGETPSPTPTPQPTPTPTPPPTPQSPEPSLWEQQVDAARLLQQATFGASLDAIDAVVEAGAETWLDTQMGLPTSSHVDYLNALTNQVERDDIWREHRIEAWWNAALTAPDQLRQRVAYALSQLMVISDKSIFSDDQFGMANYYDLLASHAFGNYRDLLEDVTRSPIMGMYLSMLGNEKPDAARNIRPDENYARELMQLFSIGLVELGLDGTPLIGTNGEPIATYDQAVIEAYAHVFTGWNFSPATEFTWYNWWQNYDTLNAMEPVEAFHDTGEKLLLNNVLVPAGQSAEQDLTMALDSLFMHPNVGPFVSRHLIQQLVTSNPSPAYIARVASVFNDNGEGIRGDLGATIKALLLDEEARSGHHDLPQQFGKLKEPIIKQTQLWRAFSAFSPNQRMQLGYPDYIFNQAPLSSPSVFNFYLPDYSEPGELASEQLVAPELQIITETYVVRATNFIAYSTLWGHQVRRDPADDKDILVSFDAQIALLDQPEELLEQLNLLLLSGAMSDQYEAILAEALTLTDGLEPADRVANLVFLILSSPQFAVQM
ncbi:DUF1800 domain-containing protein [Alteromonas flava]|uniref:DUF1800 domain-containing protein n=1 Tax=Alteromonas flava TaxID=2048003 RepID=UPI000F5D6224|nr:DUF1800 family protein [Alteromonas flava]